MTSSTPGRPPWVPWRTFLIVVALLIAAIAGGFGGLYYVTHHLVGDVAHRAAVRDRQNCEQDAIDLAEQKFIHRAAPRLARILEPLVTAYNRDVAGNDRVNCPAVHLAFPAASSRPSGPPATATPSALPPTAAPTPGAGHRAPVSIRAPSSTVVAHTTSPPSPSRSPPDRAPSSTAPSPSACVSAVIVSACLHRH